LEVGNFWITSSAGPKRISVNCLSTEPSVENHILWMFESNLNHKQRDYERHTAVCKLVGRSLSGAAAPEN
ncbi:hypothetical protein X801_02914, partial [Opisthorchis viverrini]